MNRTKQINKLLKKTKCSYSPYDTFGKVYKLNLFVLLIAFDFVIPSFRLITLFAVAKKKVFEKTELLRITINNR